MPSYQPLNLPAPNPDGLGIAETLFRARQEDRQRRLDAFNEMVQQGESQRAQTGLDIRQRELDIRERLAAEERARAEQERTAERFRQVSDLHSKGLAHEAQQLAKLYGFDGAAVPSNTLAPVAPDAPREPSAPEFVGPIDSPEHASSLARQEASARLSPQDGAVMPRAIEAGDDAADQARQQQAERDRYGQSLATYHHDQEQFPAQQQDYQRHLAEFDESASNPTYEYTTPGGARFTVDPMERIRAARAKNAENADRFKAIFSQEPAMSRYAGEFAARAELGEAPRDVLSDFRARQHDEAAAAAKAEHDAVYSPDVAQQDKWHKLAAEAAREAAHAKSSSGQESANDRVMGLLDRRAKAVRETSQFNKLVQADKTVRGVMVNIADGTVPLQHGDAQIQLAKYFRGAVPTGAEMHHLYDRLGGTLDKWNQFLATMENGDLSDEQLRQVKASAAAVKAEHQEDLNRFQKVAVGLLGPKSGLDLVPDQADAYYRAMGAELGLDDLPPLYPTEGGIKLGDKKAPTVRPRQAPKVMGDAEIVNRARAVISDPHESADRKAKAQRVLDLNRGK